MKKILLTLCALLMAVSGAWADDVTVTIADQTDLAAITNQTLSEATTVHKYGTYSSGTGGTTFTTNSTSKLAGLTITSTSDIIKPTYYDGVNYKHCFALKPTVGYGTNYTITITAPTGYYIKSYSMKAISTSNNGKFNVTPSGGSTTTVGADQTTIEATVNASTSTFTIVRNTGTNNSTELCIPRFTVTLASTTLSGTNSVNVTSSTGNLLRDNGSAYQKGRDHCSWTSTEAEGRPAGIVFTTNNTNSMNVGESSVKLHSNCGTYTITAPTGYFIKGYKMSVYCATANHTITPAQSTTSTLLSQSSETPTIICVDDINLQSTTFARGGSGAYAIAEMTIYVVPTYTITYNVVDGSGNILASATYTDITSNPTTPSLPTAAQNDYCTYDGKFYSKSDLKGETVTGSISSNTTLYTGFTVNTGTCPVTFSTVGSPVYYYLRIRDNYIYAATSDATNPSVSNSSVATKEGAWAFIGNPYSFKIINKLVGTSKFLARNTDVNSGENPGTKFTTDGTSWTMNSHYKGGGFRIYDSSISPLGHIYYTGIDLVWLSWAGTSADENCGGRFIASAYSDDFTSQVTSNIKPYFAYYSENGEKYFGINESTYNTYNSTVTERELSCTEEQYEDLYSNVVSGLIYPSTGFYRLVNYTNSNHLKYNGSLTCESAPNDVASVAYLNCTDGTHFTIQLQGAYLQNPSSQSAQATLSSSSMVFTATIAAPGYVTLVGPNPQNGYQNLGINGTTTYGRSSGETTAWWQLVDATSATVSLTPANDNTGAAHTYATLCVPFNVTSLTGVDEKEVLAYAPTISGDYVVPGTGATEIAAGTPVILIGEDADATSVTAAIGENYVTAPVSATLTGTFTNTSIDVRAATGTKYVLGFDASNGNRIGFYHVNNESFGLKANRAYLATGAGGNVKGFAINFDEMATGINNVEKAATDKVIYDLSGRRVSQPTRGLYIVNGKKVAVK